MIKTNAIGEGQMECVSPFVMTRERHVMRAREDYPESNTGEAADKPQTESIIFKKGFTLALSYLEVVFRVPAAVM